MTKPRPANYTAIPLGDPAQALLAQARRWHTETQEAKIALTWKRGNQPNGNGQTILGRCIKVSSLQKEFADFDFIITLSQEHWQKLDERQRLALLDHELSHAAPSNDKKGTQIKDERGRLQWRTRKHDIEEFRSVVLRHGCYKADLEAFSQAMHRRDATPLFAQETNSPKEATA